MAKMISAERFNELRVRPGRPTMDVSESWFSGERWEFVRGEDFDMLATSFGQLLRRQARKRRMRVEVSVPNSETVVMQPVTHGAKP